MYYVYGFLRSEGTGVRTDTLLVESQCFSVLLFGRTAAFLGDYAPSQAGFRTSRISILFTVMRLTSPFGVLRRWLIVIFVAFLATWGVLFGQSFWVCESQPGWKLDPRPQCVLGPKVAITRIISKPAI